MQINKDLVWGITIITVSLILSGTIVWLTNHPLTFSIGIENKTLEFIQNLTG